MNNKRIEILEKIFEKRKKKGSHEIISLEAINLKTIRETMYIRDNPKKLTQRELAEELGIKENSLTKIEKCTEKLKFEHALKISHLYDVSIDYIYGLTDFPREEMRYIQCIRNFLKIERNNDIKKKDQNDNWKDTQELFLTIDTDELKYLINFQKLEDDRKAESISQEEYEYSKNKLEKEFESKMNDIFKKMYSSWNTEKFALISVKEIEKIEDEELFNALFFSTPTE